jgi:hypothetical protein
VLLSRLTSNPLACLVCGLEVPPERIGFSSDLAEALAVWRMFHDSFYYLWLDSGEFESWAKAQLENPASAVNTRGLELVKRLNEHHRAYYCWFNSSCERDVPRFCQRCNTVLLETRSRLLCEACSIAIAVSSPSDSNALL